MGLFDIVSGQKIPHAIQRRVMIAEAQATEKVVNVHNQLAARFVFSLRHYLTAEEAMEKYVTDMALGEEMAVSVKNRVFSALEDAGEGAQPQAMNFSLNPKKMVNEIKRQRERAREAELRSLYLLSISLEEIIHTHTECAIEFVFILDGHVPAPRAIEIYLENRELVDSLQQLIYQKAVARIGVDYMREADVKDLEEEQRVLIENEVRIEHLALLPGDSIESAHSPAHARLTLSEIRAQKRQATLQ